jgi:hypothetical protein
LAKLTKENADKLDDLAQRAIDCWGVPAQFGMVKEECLELALEVQRIDRGRHDDEKILEESVDVYIMMKEMFIIFGEERVNAMMAKKLGKFESHLVKSEKKEAA